MKKILVKVKEPNTETMIFVAFTRNNEHFIRQKRQIIEIINKTHFVIPDRNAFMEIDDPKNVYPIYGTEHYFSTLCRNLPFIGSDYRHNYYFDNIENSSLAPVRDIAFFIKYKIGKLICVPIINMCAY